MRNTRSKRSWYQGELSHQLHPEDETGCRIVNLIATSLGLRWMATVVSRTCEKGGMRINMDRVVNTVSLQSMDAHSTSEYSGSIARLAFGY